MRKYIYILIGVTLSLTSCNFLDQEPDLRSEINTQKKVQMLLVSGYQMPNIAGIGETMSDNDVDNNAPDSRGKCFNEEPLEQMYTQMFTFQDVTSASFSNQDSPAFIWNNCYHNIAVANQAIEAINQLEKDGGPKLNTERAEALMIRAYNHFILVNIFCHAYKDATLSKQDVGIHYMTSTESTVRPQYERGTVAEVYKNIEKDLVDALETYGVDDSYYSVPKYHFNKNAAYAFAARFYLFTRQYDKVVRYADLVLGSTPASLMWDAKTAKEYGNVENERNAWFDAKSPANLMISDCHSVFSRSFFPGYNRFVINYDPLDMTINGPGPNWTSRFPGFNIWHVDQKYGAFLTKIDEYFEYTDKVAGIGMVHMLRREFTTGETLLCRAEAQIMLGNIDAAIADMDTWTKGYLCTIDLTRSNIESFFSKRKNTIANSHLGEQSYERYFQIVPNLHCQDLTPEWTAFSEDKLPYIWCVLHLRRIENMHDGTRFFDIKRYGMEVIHYFGSENKRLFLCWNDDRKAVQLPPEVQIAGMKPNERKVIGDNVVPYISGNTFYSGENLPIKPNGEMTILIK